MTNSVLEILDTTLRDGIQAPGVSFSQADKLAVISSLKKLGLGLIEVGNPSSAPLDNELIQNLKDIDGIATFGSTRRKNGAVETDLATLKESKAKTICIFGKCWDLHVEKVLETTLENNLTMIAESVDFLNKNSKRVIFDAEHFFDGYKHNKEYAIKCLEVAKLAGAKTLTLCDTNGGSFPDEVFEATAEVVKLFSDVKIGIHCHNDNGCAVANTLFAVKAGATHLQGTMLGFGERCGNANLATIIANLELKMGYKVLDEDKVKLLTKTCREIAEIANLSLDPTAPYVGVNAFTHKAGMHCDGVTKESVAFEHTSPESVGNKRNYLLSDLSGKTALLQKLTSVYPDLEKDSDELRLVSEKLKEKEVQGYDYEGADGSFLVLAQKVIGNYAPFFELVNFRVITEQPHSSDSSATAVIKVKVGDKFCLESAEGDGPVHALDKALRMALQGFYPSIQKVSLIDFKVRVLDSKDTTGAVVKATITSSDGVNTWKTVGMSTDIIEASFFALCDSIDYKLLSLGEASL